MYSKPRARREALASFWSRLTVFHCGVFVGLTFFVILRTLELIS
jgi:hypothetical protein